MRCLWIMFVTAICSLFLLHYQEPDTTYLDNRWPPFLIWFCRERFAFAWTFCFCVNVLLLRECFALAVNVLLLPWEFCSCRDELWIAVIVFVFAVSVYSLPGVIWICCFKIVFCGDELSFGVTVVGHRIRASHSSRVTKWPGYYARSVWYRQSPKAAWPSG